MWVRELYNHINCVVVKPHYYTDVTPLLIFIPFIPVPLSFIFVVIIAYLCCYYHYLPHVVNSIEYTVFNTEGQLIKGWKRPSAPWHYIKLNHEFNLIISHWSNPSILRLYLYHITLYATKNLLQIPKMIVLLSDLKLMKHIKKRLIPPIKDNKCYVLLF